MPIYEYRCESCGERFEKLVRLDAPTPECPSCGADDEVKKLVSASGFVLKGGGWYKDHYGLKSGGSSSSADGGGSGKGSSDGGSAGGGGSDGGGSSGGSSGSSSPSAAE